MKFKSLLDFEEFLNEEDIKKLNLDTEDNGKNIGVVDMDDPETAKKINRIKSVLEEETIKILVRKMITSTNAAKEGSKLFKQIEDIIKSKLKDYLIYDDSTDTSTWLEEFKKNLENPLILTGKFNRVVGANELSEHYGKFLKTEFWPSIISAKVAANASTGPGELALALFTDLNFATGQGDLSDANGNNVEIKGNGGSLKAGVGKDPDNLFPNMYKIILDAFEKNETPLTDEEKKDIDFTKATSLVADMSLKILMLTSKAYLKTKNKSFLTNITRAFPNYIGTSIPTGAQNILKDLLVEVNGKTPTTEQRYRFEHWWMILDLFSYSQIEKFENFIVLGVKDVNVYSGDESSAIKTTEIDLVKTFLLLKIKGFKQVYNNTLNKIKLSGRKAKKGKNTEIKSVTKNW